MAPSISTAVAAETNTPPQPTSGLLSPKTTTPNWTPQTVLSTLPAHSLPTTHTPSPIPFFHALTRLKTTKREGWRRFSISHGESIADHMYRMSIITLLCPPSLSSRLDLARCTKMALVHDMAELLVGDITPVDGVPKPEKSRRETETMEYLCSGLLGKVDAGAQGEGIREVWQEYEDGVTLESKFVHDVDKLELVLQMLEYEREGGGEIDLGEFTWVAERIELPEVRAWCEEVLAERGALWKGLGKPPSGNVGVGEVVEGSKAVDAERKAQQQEYYGNGH